MTDIMFHQAIALALRDNDVDVIFGVLGDANLFMMNSFENTTDGTYVSLCHESGAITAANGYARVANRVGVATVTCGPGLTNTVTALVESVRDRTPLVVLAGDSPVRDRNNLQTIDQAAVIRPTGAGFEQLRTPSSVCEDVATAFRRARTERRPIVLNIPIEFQWQTVQYTKVESRPLLVQAVEPNPSALDAAVGIIASASRPIVIVGQGAVDPEARSATMQLARRIEAPLATTLRAKDLFAGEHCNIGVFGMMSTDVAIDIVNQSDCIIAFGASLNSWTTLEGSLLRSKAVVHVDTNPTAINEWSTATAGVVGDAATVANTIVAWLDEADIKPSGFASAELAAFIAEGAAETFIDQSTETTIDRRTALQRIDRAVPADRALVFDGGRFVFGSYGQLTAHEPAGFIHTVNFASIGLGMGNAIGAFFARPDRPVLAVLGDGGFMLGGLNEFNSAVRHGVDAIVIVLNDGAYGAEYDQFQKMELDPAMSVFAWPDLGPVADALGGRGFTVRNLAELDAALEAITTRDRPVLIDIKIDPDIQTMGRFEK
ncbi:thiamine pyrophosphate-binding protein [Mycobacterium sp. Aquia_216]|uniref:thiamine pyrophosphate-binding protein n=1 Tax=Mycobacterium sp. Aquia_216 TaxID=2991729 RepID=UPI00227A6388|nr:thiamine pyrophosphate-binding protein [Mycobacterium sp. Aquia_216]WAJ44330.1 thiamine pyrophosphate-binding protein [Mycobacterium sp. Aquia_216]